MATIASVSRLSDRVPGSVSSFGCVFAVVGLLTGKLSMNAIRRLLMSISSASRYQDSANARNSDRSSSVSMLSDGNAMQRISPTFVGRMCLLFSVPWRCPSPKLLPGEICSNSSLLSLRAAKSAPETKQTLGETSQKCPPLKGRHWVV